MTELVTWVIGQIKRDEQSALALPTALGGVRSRWSPAKLVVDCRAKLDLLAYDGPLCHCSGYENPPTHPRNRAVPIPHHYDCPAYEAAKYFALPYAGFTGYRKEWRP